MSPKTSHATRRGRGSGNGSSVPCAGIIRFVQGGRTLGWSRQSGGSAANHGWDGQRGVIRTIVAFCFLMCWMHLPIKDQGGLEKPLKSDHTCAKVFIASAWGSGFQLKYLGSCLDIIVEPLEHHLVQNPIVSSTTDLDRLSAIVFWAPGR